MNTRKTFAITELALVALLAACGTRHPAGAPDPSHSARAAAPPAAAPSAAASSAAGPFVNWSPVCQRVAADLQAVGYTYTGNGNWNITQGTATYGQMEKLGSKFAHLSYVEMFGNTGNGDSQTANDLGNSGTGFFKYLPPAAWINSKFDQVMDKAASLDAINDWDQKYLNPIITDCANGGG